MTVKIKVNRIPLAALATGNYNINTQLLGKDWNGNFSLHTLDGDLVISFEININRAPVEQKDTIEFTDDGFTINYDPPVKLY